MNHTDLDALRLLLERVALPSSTEVEDKDSVSYRFSGVAVLAKKKRDPNVCFLQGGWTELHWASLNGNVDQAMHALEIKVDVNASSNVRSAHRAAAPQFLVKVQARAYICCDGCSRF